MVATHSYAYPERDSMPQTHGARAFLFCAKGWWMDWDQQQRYSVRFLHRRCPNQSGDRAGTGRRQKRFDLGFVVEPRERVYAPKKMRCLLPHRAAAGWGGVREA